MLNAERGAVAIPLFFLLALSSGSSHAQDNSTASVHWAYSTYFGTGWYRVAGDRDVFVARMTARWDARKPALNDRGGRELGLQFRLPVSIGLDKLDVDDLSGTASVENVTFLSVNPGVDVEIPVNRVWSLRPYASLGYGQGDSGGRAAWTYWGGIKSRVALDSGETNWRLVSQLGYVGYTTNEKVEDHFWPVMAGVEIDFPVGKPAETGNQLLLHLHSTYTFFGSDVEFSADQSTSATIEDQWEVGIAIGRRESRLKLWFLNFEMLGLGYRTSSNGNLKGMTFVFRSVFEQ